MNIKAKNSLIIIVTLIIGIVIGFLISGRVTNYRVENMRSDFTDQGMHSHLMRVIKPTPRQLEEIEPIFEKYANMRKEQLFNHLNSQKKMFRDFEMELKPFLDDDQILRIERMKHNYEDRFHNFKQGRMKNGRGQGRNQRREGANN